MAVSHSHDKRTDQSNSQAVLQHKNGQSKTAQEKFL